jgi:hypothetical protein
MVGGALLDASFLLETSAFFLQALADQLLS